MSEKHAANRTATTEKKETEKSQICPACSLKCPLNTPSCEHGQRYAEEQKQKKDGTS